MFLPCHSLAIFRINRKSILLINIPDLVPAISNEMSVIAKFVNAIVVEYQANK
jgi:hypothetical protein